MSCHNACCRYLKERFGWAEVTEEAIDNVIDNSDAIELGLDDRCKQAVRHALGQEKAVVFSYVFKPCPSLAIPPHSCLCTLLSLTPKLMQVSAAQGRFPVFCCRKGTPEAAKDSTETV